MERADVVGLVIALVLFVFALFLPFLAKYILYRRQALKKDIPDTRSTVSSVTTIAGSASSVPDALNLAGDQLPVITESRSVGSIFHSVRPDKDPITAQVLVSGVAPKTGDSASDFLPAGPSDQAGKSADIEEDEKSARVTPVSVGDQLPAARLSAAAIPANKQTDETDEEWPALAHQSPEQTGRSSTNATDIRTLMLSSSGNKHLESSQPIDLKPSKQSKSPQPSRRSRRSRRSNSKQNREPN
jgi:hypothetical protein